MKTYKKIIKRNKSIIIFFIDFILLGLAFFFVVFVKRGSIYLTPDYRLLLGVYYLLWIAACILSKKNYIRRPKNYFEGLKPFLRCLFYLFVLLFFALYILQLFHYSRFILIFTLMVYFVMQTGFYSILYLLRWGLNVDVIEDDHTEFMEQTEVEEESDFSFDKKERNIKEPLKNKLKEILDKEYKSIFDFIDSSIDLNLIDASESLMLDTEYSHNGLGVMNSCDEFVGNIRMVNDIKNIDWFFRAVNGKLINGGYFYGRIETLEQRLKRRYSKYPKFFRKFLFFLDFIWTRVFPKMPVLKGIYRMIRGSKFQVISKSEVLGRLFFCGFKLVRFDDVDNKFNFIVKKVKEPLKDKSPSYGLLFKQRRVGEGGEIIYTYKFRTMHPYSEYNHKYMLKNGELNNIGKLKNDIRIPGWGRKMRKYWIDEIPMLINFLQGDLKLVGLRPLSMSFFSIYPEDLKGERIKYKPGLVPSLYADMQDSIEEIWESERRYIEKYKKHPWRTDISYFFKVMNNIVFRGIRSG